MQRRVILLVLDGVGAGEAPDAAAFGDTDHPSTLAHVWDACGGLRAPVLSSLGFFRAGGILDSVPLKDGAAFGRLQELSQGKDSVTGHWEMMGIITEKAFPTYPNGFPISLIKEFESRIGTQTIGNCAASGTQIIQDMGELHCETGFPIVYTSADSVFQIAAHESVVSLERLYEMCGIAREICVDANNIQRVIARPFVGDATHGFTRTGHRKDFPAVPPANLIDEIGDVFGIGVVPELFNHRGFRSVKRTQNNAEHTLFLQEALKSDARFIFANFEDFDMLYGHRNDPKGMGRALETMDNVISMVLEAMGPEDLLMITADHGNDPTTASTDHSREYVPISLYPWSQQGALGDLVGMNHIAGWIKGHLKVSE